MEEVGQRRLMVKSVFWQCRKRTYKEWVRLGRKSGRLGGNGVDGIFNWGYQLLNEFNIGCIFNLLLV